MMTLHRQPIHTFYGGAHLFSDETVPKMGLLAVRQLLESAPDCFSFAEALELPETSYIPRTDNGRTSLLRRFRRRGAAARGVNEPAWFAFSLFEKVLEKLRTEAVEDFRVDFEDGYGFRGDMEEDRDAVRCARETALAQQEGTLPPFFGIRIRPLTPEFSVRALRTLDLYSKTLLDASSGRLPDGFAVTLPKVSTVWEVDTLVNRLKKLETNIGLEPGSIHIELMVEHPRVVTSDTNGTILVQLIGAGEGRVRGLHLGLYDYLSSLGIISSSQWYRHPSANHLRSVVSAVAASEKVWISDGAVNTIPVGVHRGSNRTEAQRTANEEAIYDGWREIYGHVLHSLRFGYYQGWDLHPSQLIPRYAAVYTLFMREFDRAAKRVKAFVDASAQARTDGQEFDDVATGLGLLTFFAKGYMCGAFSREDLQRTGLTPEECIEGSFSKILQNRVLGSNAKGAPKGPPA